MTGILILLIIAAMFRFLVTVLMCYFVHRFRNKMNWIQRLGLGLIAGSALLTVPVIIDNGRNGTPFDVWSGIFLSVGILVFAWGCMVRLYGHEWNNAAANRAAERHLREHGRLG
jgi:uncharacterized membrane protein YgdD (TMEM256/DUF423 family)